ncbi:hypothetical protein DBR32_05815 [Taibaiella sp. KBW10]|uniref:hypothetical protein n=1 Tax=Taibaiella sp. KBW10 TaxID=2153357 RepID=UPI000F5934DE|nr:hypothetical protein [Taibaiella sp. KBW10]RQO31476.1 hypothetical protein DBR32_05815 [Taibaiella sp. KBW10]
MGIVNTKGKVYKEKRQWKFEAEIGLKFPNAREVAVYPWLSAENMDAYRTYFSLLSIGGMVVVSSRVAFGLEFYYDEQGDINDVNSKEAYQQYLTALVKMRYCWQKEEDRPCRIYSALAVGYGKDLAGHDDNYYGVVTKRERGFEYQAVLLGLLCGRKKARFMGELGYGSMYLVKVGLNYRF